MKSKILFVTLFVLGLLALDWYFPFKDYLQMAVEFSQRQGHWGGLVFFLLYVFCGVFFIPVSPLIMVAGTVYGFGMGYLLVISACMTSIAVTYGLGKKFWRRRVELLRHSNPRFEAIFTAISKHGALLVFLIRLNPFLPFSLINYLFTIPKLDYRRYLLSSFLGISPDILLYLYVGRMGRGWLDEKGLSHWNWLILAVAVGTTAAAVFYIKHLIHEAVHPKGGTPEVRPLRASSGASS
jgi:uncharacterized membrane protein YdjX (TVP38/TMEM64 family)